MATPPVLGAWAHALLACAIGRASDNVWASHLETKKLKVASVRVRSHTLVKNRIEIGVSMGEMAGLMAWVTAPHRAWFRGLLACMIWRALYNARALHL